jgi:hypothetical protein
VRQDEIRVQLPNFSGPDPADLFGADGVIFSFAFADVAGITAVGQAFGLGGG